MWECVHKGQDSQIHNNASHGVCMFVKSNNELDTLDAGVISILLIFLNFFCLPVLLSV